MGGPPAGTAVVRAGVEALGRGEGAVVWVEVAAHALALEQSGETHRAMLRLALPGSRPGGGTARRAGGPGRSAGRTRPEEDARISLNEAVSLYEGLQAQAGGIAGAGEPGDRLAARHAGPPRDDRRGPRRARGAR